MTGIVVVVLVVVDGDFQASDFEFELFSSALFPTYSAA